MIRFNYCILLCTLIFAEPSSAQLISIFARERSGTLPQGRFLVSMVSVNASLDSLYGQDGVKKPLSSQFSQNLTFQKITSEEAVRGRQLAGLLRSNGVALEDSAGSLSGSISGSVSGQIPVLGYGLTDEWGIYLSLPVLKFKLHSTYQFTTSEATKRLVTRLNESDQRSTALEINRALDTGLENKLHKIGYQWNPDLDKNYLGDVQVSFLHILNPRPDSDLRQSLQPFIILPTSNNAELQDLYGLKAGNGRLGLGLKYAFERSLFGRFVFNFSSSATYLFATHQARRLPSSSSDDLNEEADANTWVAGGEQFQSQAQVRYLFPRLFGLNLGLQWQRELAERLEGAAYAPAVYDLGSARTSRELLSSYASVDLSTIPSFLAGHFWLPALAELGVGLPLRGRNSIAEPVIELQGSLFF